MAKISRRDFIKACSGVGVLGALTLAAGEPKRIAKDLQGAMGAVDNAFLGGAEQLMDASEDYRAGLGVKKVDDPKMEMVDGTSVWGTTTNGERPRWTHMGSVVALRDWYLPQADGGNREIAQQYIDQSWYDRQAAEEAYQGFTYQSTREAGSTAGAQLRAQNADGYTHVADAFSGFVRLIGFDWNIQPEPGRGIGSAQYQTTVRIQTGGNQQGRGLLSWKPLLTPTSNTRGKWEVTDKAQAAHYAKKAATFAGADVAHIGHVHKMYVFGDWYDAVYAHRPFPVYFTDDPGCPTDTSGQAFTEPTCLDDGTAIIPAAMHYEVAGLLQGQVQMLRMSPPGQWSTTARQYSKKVTQVAMTATFLRNLGYNAIPFSNDTAMKHPAAVACGLGETARNRQVASPEFGPGERLTGLFTDMPMETDRPIDFGFMQMCKDCKICAKNCPGEAIPLEREPDDGYERNDVKAPCDIQSMPGHVVWHNNRMRCERGRQPQGGCSNCRRFCPWVQVSTTWHERAKWLSVNMGSTGNNLLVWLYDVFGYGKRESVTAWLDEPVRPTTGISSIKRNL